MDLQLTSTHHQPHLVQYNMNSLLYKSHPTEQNIKELYNKKRSLAIHILIIVSGSRIQRVNITWYLSSRRRAPVCPQPQKFNHTLINSKVTHPLKVPPFKRGCKHKARGLATQTHAFGVQANKGRIGLTWLLRAPEIKCAAATSCSVEGFDLKLFFLSKVTCLFPFPHAASLCNNRIQTEVWGGYPHVYPRSWGQGGLTPFLFLSVFWWVTHKYKYARDNTAKKLYY